MFKKLPTFISDPAVRLVWSKRLVKAILIATALVSALVGSSIAFLNLFVVPRVSDWKSNLEQVSSEYLGSEVRIDQIKVDKGQLIPSFEFSGVNIESPNDRGEVEKLSLPGIKFALSFRSILSLSFDQIVIDDPWVSITKSSTGQLRVAGLKDFSTGSAHGLDWFFSQPNIKVNHATAIWSDEAISKGALELSDLNVNFLNGLKSHSLRLEATPPKELGERFSLQANFKESLFSKHASNFSEWSGTSLLNLPRIDLALASEYLPLHQSWGVKEGAGSLRVWLDLHRGNIDQVTTDLNFPSLFAFWTKQPTAVQKIQLKELSGRFQVILKELKNEFKTQDLKFVTEDGNHWSLGRATFAWTQYAPGTVDAPLNSTTRGIFVPMESPGNGVVEIDRISIKPLLNQLNSLAIDSEHVKNLKNIELSGDLQNFKMIWAFDGQKFGAFNLQGMLSNFVFNRLQNSDENFLKGLPGLQNAGIQFDFNNSGGSAIVNIDNGAITLSNWLEEPVVPLAHANADIRWTIDDKLINLKINKTNIVNEDAKGDFELNWSLPRRGQSPTPVNSSIVDLNINVQQGLAKQVHRYLPKIIDVRVRRYLQKAITQGSIKNGSIKIKGPVNKFPFTDPADGEFHIFAKTENLTYQYAPSEGVDSKSVTANKIWPELNHLNAELVIDRKSLFIKKATTQLNTTYAPSLEWTEISAEVPDLFKPTVIVKAKGKGPLNELIRVIKNSAVGDLLDNTLSKAESISGGSSDYLLNLKVPINELSQTKVSGAISFANDDLSLIPGFPALNRLRGSLNFNESGFSLSGVKAKILGTEAKVDGGLIFANDKLDSSKTSEPSIIKIQSTISAEGLRQSKESPYISKLGQYLNGQANYLGTLTVNKGQLDFELKSTLQGLSSQLPTPFGKNADTAMPLRVSLSVLEAPLIIKKSASLPVALPPRFLKTNITLGQVVLATIVSDLSAAGGGAQGISKAWIGISASGGLSVPGTLDPGYLLSVDLPRLDADAWDKVLSTVTTGTDSSKAIKRESLKVTASSAAPSSPIGLKIKTSELIYLNRSIHQVSLDAIFQDIQPSGQWHLNINSTEAKGVVDYRLGSANATPRIFARMGLLVIPPTAIDTVESLLNNKDTVLPALDIIVDDLEIKNKKLGRAEIEAFNQSQADVGRVWRINKLNLTVPEGKFQASGIWAFLKEGAKNQSIKKTTLDFYLEIENAGLLLDRLGTKGAVSGGKGKLSGQITWLGSPLQMDYPSMGGHFNVNIEKGSFLRTEPGAGRLLGVLNLQALPRRLLLDFKDIFSDGFSFDFFRGDVSVEAGIAKTNNLQMKGVNAAIFMEGRADISNETQNLKVIVIPEIDAGTASLVVAAINPVVGISTFLAQYFLKKPIAQATTKDFLVEGTWSDPKVTKIDTKSKP